jgi:Antitoxin VbhA
MNLPVSSKAISPQEQRRRQKAIRTSVRSTQFEGRTISSTLEQDLTKWSAGETSLDRVRHRLQRIHSRKELIHD